jgi:hypothetical protein
MILKVLKITWCLLLWLVTTSVSLLRTSKKLFFFLVLAII